MGTWNSRQTTQVVGNRVSNPININIPYAVSRILLSWVESLPSSTTALVETRVSFDGGSTWTAWKTATNGQAIQDITVPNTNLANAQFQVRYSFTQAIGQLDIPSISNFTLSVESALYASSSWESPVIDLHNVIPGTSVLNFTLGTVPTGTSVVIQTRKSFDGTNWDAWENDVSGQPFSEVGMYTQIRALFITDSTRRLSPIVLSISYSLSSMTYRGLWTSPQIDVSKAKDRSTGKVISEYITGGGALTIQSRSSADRLTWSPWFNAISDGTLIHPVNDYVQIRAIFSGATSSLSELTFSMDGDPSTTVLQSGMSPGAEYDFTTLRDTLVIVNGKDAPRKWDGLTATAQLLGGSPPVASMSETHHNRVWLIEVDNPSRVRYSDILTPETWPILNFMDFNPEDGDKITCIYRYGQNLMVSKQRSMAVLTGNTSANYSITWLDSEQGCTGQRAMCQADKYLAYVATDGIRFTDLNNSILATERLIYNWDRLNHRRLNQAAMVYWKHFLIVALPSANSLYNDQIWVFDFLRSAWSIYKNWSISNFLKFTQYGEEILLASDSMSGQVYQLMVGSSDDGVEVNYVWKSKDFDMGYPERYKVFKNIYVDVDGIEIPTNLTVEMYVDGVLTGTYTTVIEANDTLTRRILPPVYNVVLGRYLSLKIIGRCGIKKINIEYSIRGVVPSTEV